MDRSPALPRTITRAMAVPAVLVAGALFAAGTSVAPGHASPPSAIPPAKLKVSRAGVENGRLDVLAELTKRADGDRVRVSFLANKKRFEFTAPVEEGRIRFKRLLPQSQRHTSTGIVEIHHGGNERVRPTDVRLRAANGKTRLEHDLLSIKDGVITARGSLTSRAKGVVRLILSYEDPSGGIGEWQGRASVRANGSWHMQEELPVSARGGGYLSIQFTGHYHRRLRGEQIAKQVLAGDRFAHGEQISPDVPVSSTGRKKPRPAPNSAPTPEPAPVPEPVPAPSFSRVVTFELGDFSELDITGAAGGTIATSAERAYEGSRSAKATYDGQTYIAYQRTAYDAGWGSGSDVWYGAAFYIPNLDNWCWWNPIRWDNYPTYGGGGDVGGVHIDTNGDLYLAQGTFAGDRRDLVGPIPVPEGRWFWLEVHQRISAVDGQALSEVFLDGTRMGSSTRANSLGRRIDRIHYGNVSIAPQCSGQGSVFFDRASVSDAPLGPLH